MIVDEDGNIIASVLDESITRTTQKKIVALHLNLQDLRQNYIELIELKSKANAISFFEELDLNLEGFVMIINELVEEISFICIIPSWLDIASILPELKQTLVDLSKYFNAKFNPDYIECTLIL
jgi:hypothetical protein